MHGFLRRLALVVGGMALAAPSALAVEVGTLPPSQYPFETTAVTSNTESMGAFGTGTVIYGAKLVANDAGDTCGLYDIASITAANFGTAALQLAQGTFIDELVEPTDEDYVETNWPAPYVLETDLTVLTNGVCIIYHSPQ